MKLPCRIRGEVFLILKKKGRKICDSRDSRGVWVSDLDSDLCGVEKEENRIGVGDFLGLVI